MDENKQYPDVLQDFEEETVSPEESVPETAEEILSPKKKKKFRFIHVILILFALLIIAAGTVAFLFYRDYSAGGRTNETVTITLDASCSGTAQIAERLEKNGLIDNALFFRLYCRYTGADTGIWQAGDFDLTKDMGYDALIKALQSTPTKNKPLVRGIFVTIPPQFTVEEIAARLEENGICTAKDFINEVQNGDFEYDFARSIPYNKDRVYRLEGYLFPDTYEFFANTAAHDVVDQMLANLNSKLTDEIRQQIAAKGWTLDQALTFASLIEGEAASKDDMEKVSRVLHNRMDPNSGFKKLQLCSTQFYINSLSAPVSINAYDTYKREGLPVGAINNPGLQALIAALNPSTDEHVMQCYYFATDFKTGITYFNKTFSEHQADIDKYGISNNTSFSN